MMAAVMIVWVVILPDGRFSPTHEARRSLDECWAEARRFVQQDPAKFGGIALGAGCMVSGK